MMVTVESEYGLPGAGREKQNGWRWETIKGYLVHSGPVTGSSVTLFVGAVFSQRHQRPDSCEACGPWTWIGKDAATVHKAGGGWKHCAQKGTGLKL